MISEDHTMNNIQAWLNNWKTSNLPPYEIVLDESSALIGSCVKTFTSLPSRSFLYIIVILIQSNFCISKLMGEIGNSESLKTVLVSVCSDNLEAYQNFRFLESFFANIFLSVL